ncbi:hypothetical protein XU18_0731 [Perkinsela sp. CCAP 1560/4]|nr:hypothetical protein XU18_2465 [Perkinsela sp. CCAP 1560/4]KNH08876.1 hypothetical protein XU18_0731 [Perkinsela sp. CCAP 1560/4]|eukprot:KNH06757.1 hypothetical protein XU18_2465 [Perkinsela sp. CCAP 1560/4]
MTCFYVEVDETGMAKFTQRRARCVADPMEGHLFVVGWTSTPSWGKLKALLNSRRVSALAPTLSTTAAKWWVKVLSIHGEVQETAVCCYGGSRIPLDERTSTNSLWIKTRDEISSHE